MLLFSGKSYNHTCKNTLARTRNVIDYVRVNNNTFSNWNKVHFKHDKSYFKESYDKQNLTLVVILLVVISNEWLVVLGLTALWDSISVYSGTSPRERERKKIEMIDESIMSEQAPPAPTVSAVGPCPAIIKISRMPPGTGSLPSTIASPDHPHFEWNLWNSPKARFIKFLWNGHSCTILYIQHICNIMMWRWWEGFYLTRKVRTLYAQRKSFHRGVHYKCCYCEMNKLCSIYATLWCDTG